MRRLGNSDLWITTIGIGTWAIGGGGWQYGWGPQNDRDSIAAIRCALDAGINWIDTAPVYGFGRAECVVARALAGRPNRPYLLTKCGFGWDARGRIETVLTRTSIRRECERSLARLKADVIDLYQIHRPDPSGSIEEAWTALAELQCEGKVRWIGGCNMTAAQIAAANRIAPVTSVQPPYSILAREAERELLPLAARTGTGVIVYSPMQCGLLSGAMSRARIAALPKDDHRRAREEFREPLLGRVLALVQVLRAIGARHGRTAAEVAVAWTLRHPAVTGAIVGLRRREQVSGVTGALTFRLAPEEEAAIERFPIFETLPA